MDSEQRRQNTEKLSEFSRLNGPHLLEEGPNVAREQRRLLHRREVSALCAHQLSGSRRECGGAGILTLEWYLCQTRLHVVAAQVRGVTMISAAKLEYAVGFVTNW